MKPFSFHILFDVVKQRVEIREFVHHQRIYSIVPTQIRGDRREEGGEMRSCRGECSSPPRHDPIPHLSRLDSRRDNTKLITFKLVATRKCAQPPQLLARTSINTAALPRWTVCQITNLNHHLHYSIMKTKASQYKGFDIVSLCLNWALKNSPACNKDPKTIFNRKSCSGKTSSASLTYMCARS